MTKRKPHRRLHWLTALDAAEKIEPGLCSRLIPERAKGDDDRQRTLKDGSGQELFRICTNPTGRFDRHCREHSHVR